MNAFPEHLIISNLVEEQLREAGESGDLRTAFNALLAAVAGLESIVRWGDAGEGITDDVAGYLLGSKSPEGRQLRGEMMDLEDSQTDLPKYLLLLTGSIVRVVDEVGDRLARVESTLEDLQ